MKKTTCFALATLFAATAGFSDAAHAVRVSRPMHTNPTDVCQTSLPIFDGNVRKRPLSVQNEGTAPAFVTCSFSTRYHAVKDVIVYVHSSSGKTQPLTCTGVSGWNGNPDNAYLVKSVTLPGDGSRDSLTWGSGEFAGAPTYFPNGGLFSISCSLAPGMGIDNIAINEEEEIPD